MVAEVRPDYDTEWAAMKAVASKLGIGTTETLRTWVRQDQIDSESRPERHWRNQRRSRR
jgi:transposase